MPWISQKRLDNLERGAETRVVSVPINENVLRQREVDIIAAFRTLWPKHAAALRALSKERNPAADIWILSNPWPAEDVKTLLAMAESQRAEEKSEQRRAQIAALKAGVAGATDD